MTTTSPKIDPSLGAAALRVPAASREDSHPQVILKFLPLNSFDYRVRYEPKFVLLVYKYTNVKLGPEKLSNTALSLLEYQS